MLSRRSLLAAAAPFEPEVGPLAGPDCSRVYEARILVYAPGRDILRASNLVDRVSVHFRESQADYTLLATWTESGHLDHLELTCLVLSPGSDAMRNVERACGPCS